MKGELQGETWGNQAWHGGIPKGEVAGQLFRFQEWPINKWMTRTVACLELWESGKTRQRMRRAVSFRYSFYLLSLFKPPRSKGPRMRVLVVEDDRALGLFLQKGLILEGHYADWVGDGNAALIQAAEAPPDLMVLDLGLPERDGTEVLEEMRRRHEDVSVLILTGRSDVEERVRCLNLGADDYMVKPFSFHELAARCRAILRRRERFADPVLRWGSLEMNRTERTVFHAGRPVDLTAREFALLEFLLRRGGECCTRSELLREVWQAGPDAGGNVVDVYINYLRRKLAAAAPGMGDSDGVIETVRGSGYRMQAVRKKPQLDLEFEGERLAQGA